MIDVATNMSAGHAIFGPAGLLLYPETPVPSLGGASLYRALAVGITEGGESVSRVQIQEGPTTYVIAALVNDQVICRQNRLVNAAGLRADTEWTAILGVEVTLEGRALGAARRGGPGFPSTA